MGRKFIVNAYLTCHVVHQFDARDIANAREIAKRIITEGLWVIEDDDNEVFYPITQVYKVRIVNMEQG